MTDVTVFGKYLRKMQINYSEILGKMAGRLGISAAYLSAIENGCREIPEGFIEKIAKEYSLSDSQVEELKKAQAQTKGAVDVPLGSQKAEPNYIETAVMFARDFSHLSAEQVERLNRLLKDFETSGEKTKNGRKSV